MSFLRTDICNINCNITLKNQGNKKILKVQKIWDKINKLLLERILPVFQSSLPSKIFDLFK